MEDPHIIYEDKEFIAVYKPAGLLMHDLCSKKSDSRIKEPTLVDWLLKKYPEIKKVGDDPKTRPGIVHRLDRGVSGVLLVARTQAYFLYLKHLFQIRDIKKTYLALVYGEVNPVREFAQSAFSNGAKEKKGIIDAPIGIRSGTVKRGTRGKDLKMLKTAVTEYRILREIGRESYELRGASDGAQGTTFTLLEIAPKTGRTHQIRVHLASIGHPIVGDHLYGPKLHSKSYILNSSRIMLHALSLEFTTEEGKRIKIEAEPPQEFKDLEFSS